MPAACVAMLAMQAMLMRWVLARDSAAAGACCERPASESPIRLDHAMLVEPWYAFWIAALCSL